MNAKQIAHLQKIRTLVDGNSKSGNAGIRSNTLTEQAPNLIPLLMGISLDNKSILLSNKELEDERIKKYMSLVLKYSKYIDPEPIEAEVYNKGNEKVILSDYLVVITENNRSIEINLNKAVEHKKKGNEKVVLGDYRGALTEYNKSIEINPNDGETYNSRGVGKVKQGDYNGAIADFNISIEINPHNEEAYNNRGNANYNLGDINKASLDWSKADELRMRKKWVN